MHIAVRDVNYYQNLARDRPSMIDRWWLQRGVSGRPETAGKSPSRLDAGELGGKVRILSRTVAVTFP
jgi:hypothetical protein